MTAANPLPAYSVPRHPAPIDLRLDGNEGRCPLSEAELQRALQGLRAERYPSLSTLEARLATLNGVSPEQVLVSNGADDLLLRAARVDLGPGRPLLLPSPGFEMLPRFAQWCGARTLRVPWPGPSFPLQAVLSQGRRAGAIAVISPNNPTGAVIGPKALAALGELGVPLWLDQAYGEYQDPPSPLGFGPKVSTFRTLSKAWGLAGLRVGYAIASPDRIATLRAAGLPYPVGGPSIAIALAALAAPKLDAAVTQVRRERAALTSLLRALGLTPQDSQANFVFARTPQALWLRDALASQGIGIRTWPSTPSLADALRITCPGEPTDFERLEGALRTALQPRRWVLARPDPRIAAVASARGIELAPWSQRSWPGSWVFCQDAAELAEAPGALRLFWGRQAAQAHGAARSLSTSAALEALCP